MSNFNSSRVFQTFTITFISILCILFNTLTIVNYHKFELSKNNMQYIIKGVSGSVYAKNGLQTYSVQSSYVYKYPQDDRIFMSNILIEKHQNNSLLINYLVKSKKAWFNNQINIICLGENTYFKINNINPKKTVEIRSNNVYIDIKKEEVYGNDELIANQGKSMIYSKGFKYNNKLQYLTLKSKVKVIYDN